MYYLEEKGLTGKIFEYVPRKDRDTAEHIWKLVAFMTPKGKWVYKEEPYFVETVSDGVTLPNRSAEGPSWSFPGGLEFVLFSWKDIPEDEQMEILKDHLYGEVSIP